ncbi:hypothetical protein [Cytobacillus purgationiresistens]|uniref:Uncharacterized protein n=1 Tax=Cytobacillus purgationiresistens TaxID=863449 RepID=A0ABU0ALD3_9BACI|nr:hypothetical protein [Cytobacillus purgationiresistens]MDQ0271699.1 hypothetical protein [Cytobacillus purgationiresistens]
MKFDPELLKVLEQEIKKVQISSCLNYTKSKHSFNIIKIKNG